MFTQNKILKYGWVNTAALLLILLTAAGLRLWDFAALPFMHDEFSALFRTHYDTFSELIKLGVMQNDSHPAGVQVFLYYWTKLFGFNACWVKLPFALSGIVAVWLVFLLGRDWFNETTGLFAASCMAVMQFFVFYSQLARPYAAGLFAVLLLAYFWTRLIKQPNASFRVWAAFTVSLSLTALMHAFSAFFAGLLYLSGFFALRKEKRITYIWSGLSALLLYSPHLPVFWHQLSAGTIGGWLGKPDANFLPDFFSYLFHFEILFAVVVLLLLLLSSSPRTIRKPLAHFFRLSGAIWFLVAFFVAYFYSIWRSPILQYSTLYFSTPFLLLALASFIKKLQPVYNLGMVVLILASGTYSLIHNRQHYELMYQQGFDQIALEAAKDRQALCDSLQVAIRSATVGMPAFYAEKQKLNAVQYFSREEKPHMLKAITGEKNYLAFGWTDYAAVEWVENARLTHPFILRYRAWFNSEYLLLSNRPVRGASRHLADEKLFSHLHFDEQTEKELAGQGISYSQPIEIKSDYLRQNRYDIVSSVLHFSPLDSINNLHLVLEIKSEEDGTITHWQSAQPTPETLIPNQSYTLITAIRLHAVKTPNGPYGIRTYLWNPDKIPIIRHEQYLRLRKQDRRILGLYQKI